MRLLDALAMRVMGRRILHLEKAFAQLNRRTRRLEWKMAKNKEALARLDEQIEALRAYVESDDETDAAEVDRRVESLRQMLASAQGSGEVAPDEVAEVEANLGEVVAQANEQTGR